jgi:2-polyprenyl-6-hydroxyphenyl methylase/3-demethylubiquinone-9 3-methyltransferase
MSDFAAVAVPTAPCKVCGVPAPLFGVCDFNRSCEEHRGKVLPMSGIPIYYRRCPNCGFLFTNAFDAFSNDDFKQWIYNDQYGSIDPDYAASRPANNAMLVADLVGAARNTHILDYGSGNGSMADTLRQRGYDVTEYDPFVAHSNRRPEGLFDLITAFEVLEHSIDPRQTIQDIAGLLADPGMILFSTLVQTDRIVTTGMNWWYIGPRNGHASVYTRRSLEVLANSLNLGFGSFNDVLHVILRRIPPFAAGRIAVAR